MILVTLGTQDKEFKRLLDAIQHQIDNKKINEEVVVQAGCTKYESKDMKIFDLIPSDEFNKLIEKCDILISHGGVGSIITGLKNNKKVVVAARLKKYDEHTNDHQLQIVEQLEQDGYIIGLHDFDKLDQYILAAKNMKRKLYKSNTANIINYISDYIDNN